MSEPLVIVGAGGFGRETIELVAALNAAHPRYDLLGVLDDGIPDAALLGRLGVPHLGGCEAIRALPGGTRFVVGIGSGPVRRRIATRLQGWGFRAATLVAPGALVGGDVTLGPGCIVAPGACLTTNIRVGAFVHIDRGSQVGHDCVLDDYVTVNPLVAVSGAVRLGVEVNVGTHATILPGRTVGARSVIGAGAVVTRDVAADLTVAGVPARALPPRT